MPEYELTIEALSEEDTLFLKKYKHLFSIEDVFCARYSISAQERMDSMEDEGKIFALMKTCDRCIRENRGRRNLHTKYGHCIYCNNSAVTFIKQRNKAGHVYIAGSTSKRLIKIGSTDSPGERQGNLNQDGYAGASDWRFLTYSKKVGAAGKIEADIQRSLREKRHKMEWIRQGEETIAGETFACSFSCARKAFESYLELKYIAPELHLYEFNY